MYLLRLGHSIRVAREARNLSQAELAERAGVSRPTISLLENGLVSDLGVKKVAAIADVLGLALDMRRKAVQRAPDAVRIACSAANVSHRELLGEDELVAALLSGHAPPNKRAHCRVVLEELPRNTLQSVFEQIAEMTGEVRVRRGAAKLAAELNVAVPT